MSTSIAEYRKRHGLTQAALAERFKTQQPYLSQIEAGKRRPSPKLALVIEKETDGEIPFAQWFTASTSSREAS